MEEPVTVASVQLLIAQKDAIESELLATRAWLTSPASLGLSGGILDSEGYPINDVEKIIATREARGKLARLQNDHIDIMKKIESGIALLHAKAREEGTPQTLVTKPQEASTSPVLSTDELSSKYSHLKAFALVNSVAQLSPSFKANLREGDKIILFGTVDSAAGGLGKVSTQVVEDQEVVTVVRRTGEDGVASVVELSLKPSKWAGPGLLGCHLLPISE